MGILHQPERSSLLSIVVFAVYFLAFSQYALPPRFVRAHEPAPKPAASVSPTPTPSPEWKPKKTSTLRRVLHFLKCNEHKLIKEQELFRTGPQLPDSYNPSDFSFPALVQGGWPVVVVYELEIGSRLIIAVQVKDVEPFYKKLAGAGQGQEIMFEVPERFGKKPQAALVSIKATPDDPKEKKPTDFRLYALGMGDEAIGSVPITARYQPDKINTGRRDQLNYSLDSRKAYDDVRAEFWRVRTKNGRRRPESVYSKELGAIREKDPKAGQWDGRNTRTGRGFSIGVHEFHVNARVRGPWIMLWLRGVPPITVE